MAAIYSVRNGRGRFTVHGLVAISDIYNADRPSAPHSWTVAAAAAPGRKGKGERRATCRIKYGLRWVQGTNKCETFAPPPPGHLAPQTSVPPEITIAFICPSYQLNPKPNRRLTLLYSTNP